LGIVPALIAAVVGGGAWGIFVAIVTGHLATNLRRQADLARRRETEVHDLYAFSRRLAVAHTPSDIYTAIREHLTSIIGRRTILLETAPQGAAGAAGSSEERVPEQVKRATAALAERRKGSTNGRLVEDGEGRVWLVRPVSGKAADFGVLAIDLGQQAGKMADTIREQVDAVLADATATLEHLDLGRALSDARVRSETEALRDALIGSVSHQLRTPLVSILGAATVISQARGNSGDPRLASLADILRAEVDRLNNDVQDLLDAALISSKAVRLACEWIEPADIVNVARSAAAVLSRPPTALGYSGRVGSHPTRITRADCR
jgi:two-component system, OmpR family, sensor histidine kinase KdpD